MSDETEIIIEAGPFTVDMGKKEMIEHLVEVHGLHRAGKHTITGGTTRATKDDLVEAHDRTHAWLNSPTRYVDPHNPEYYRFPDRRGIVKIPSVNHVHADLTLSGAAREVLDAARGDKPISDKLLSAGTRATLTKLINNDFDSVISDMKQFAADALVQALKEIEMEWADRRSAAPRYEQKVRAELRRFMKRYDRLKEEAAAEGIKLSINRHDLNAYVVPSTVVDGYEKAKKQATDDNKVMLDRAILTANRQRLTMTRRILLSGLDAEAAEILNQVPSAQEMMIQAQSTSTTTQLEGSKHDG